MQPTDHHTVLARAANILKTNGIHRGDYVADPFNRRSTTPHDTRPMSVVGAINCAVTDDPRTPSNLAWLAISALACVVLVNGEPAMSRSLEDQERHVDAWSDSVSADYAIHFLLNRAGQRPRRAVAA
jgi:hypothetical protein